MHLDNWFDSDTLFIRGANPPRSKGMFKINLVDVASAVVLAVSVAVLGYIVSVTDIASLSGHQILNIAVLTAAGSLLKALLTTQTGTVAGIKVK